MTIAPRTPDARSVRQLIPLSLIAKSRFAEMCEQLTVEELEQGAYLFKRGDSTNDLIYLLDGRISLCTEEFSVETITAGSETAKFALAHQIPRKIDALAKTNVRYLRFNADMIKKIQSTSGQEEENPMVVEETEEDSGDWMTMLLRTPIFRSLPPSNLQRVLIGLEEVSFKSGETIIEQGEQGDYYYLIKNGQCLISRKPTPSAKEFKLGQLKSQDTFGEDSILSGEPRNVTVRAETDVTLLRLNKENFVNLIEKPTLKYIDYAELQSEANRGAAVLDIRSPDEHKKHHLEQSVNVPFFSLRMHFKTLAKQQPVIVVCENGKTSKAAAFLLMRNKIDALVLKGGMEKIPVESEHKAVFEIDEGGTGTGKKQTNDSVQEAEDAYHEDPSVHIETETDQLKQTIARLEEKCKALADEKEELARKYKLLFKQTEKMKALIDSIRNNQD